MVDKRPYGLVEGGSQALEIVSAHQIDRHMGLLERNAMSDLVPP
jgi:hypothetical protein